MMSDFKFLLSIGLMTGALAYFMRRGTDDILRFFKWLYRKAFVLPREKRAAQKAVLLQATLQARHDRELAETLEKFEQTYRGQIKETA